MKWIIRHGTICDIDGTAIKISDLSGGAKISNMTIKNAKNGIVIGDSPDESERLTVDDLVKNINERLDELPESKRQQVKSALDYAKEESDDDKVKETLKFIYDVAKDVSGSVIASLLKPLFS